MGVFIETGAVICGGVWPPLEPFYETVNNYE